MIINLIIIFYLMHSTYYLGIFWKVTKKGTRNGNAFLSKKMERRQERGSNILKGTRNGNALLWKEWLPTFAYELIFLSNLLPIQSLILRLITIKLERSCNLTPVIPKWMIISTIFFIFSSISNKTLRNFHFVSFQLSRNWK